MVKVVFLVFCHSYSLLEVRVVCGICGSCIGMAAGAPGSWWGIQCLVPSSATRPSQLTKRDGGLHTPYVSQQLHVCASYLDLLIKMIPKFKLWANPQGVKLCFLVFVCFTLLLFCFVLFVVSLCHACCCCCCCCCCYFYFFVCHNILITKRRQALVSVRAAVFYLFIYLFIYLIYLMLTSAWQ